MKYTTTFTEKHRITNPKFGSGRLAQAVYLLVARSLCCHQHIRVGASMEQNVGEILNHKDHCLLTTRVCVTKLTDTTCTCHVHSGKAEE